MSGRDVVAGGAGVVPVAGRDVVPDDGRAVAAPGYAVVPEAGRDVVPVAGRVVVAVWYAVTPPTGRSVRQPAAVIQPSTCARRRRIPQAVLLARTACGGYTGTGGASA